MERQAENPAIWIAVSLIVGVIGLVLVALGSGSENLHSDRATTLGGILLAVAALSFARGAWLALRR